MLPTAKAGSFSWWCRSPVLHERLAGHPPDYLARARILGKVNAMHLCSLSRAKGRGDTPAVQGVHRKSKQRPRFYALAFPGQPPTYDSVKVPVLGTTRACGSQGSACLAADAPFIPMARTRGTLAFLW